MEKNGRNIQTATTISVEKNFFLQQCTNTNTNTNAHKLIIISKAVIVANLFFVVFFLKLSDKGFSGQTTNEICFQVAVDDDGSSTSSSNNGGGDDGGAPAPKCFTIQRLLLVLILWFHIGYIHDGLQYTIGKYICVQYIL